MKRLGVLRPFWAFASLLILSATPHWARGADSDAGTSRVPASGAEAFGAGSASASAAAPFAAAPSAAAPFAAAPSAAAPFAAVPSAAAPSLGGSRPSGVAASKPRGPSVCNEHIPEGKARPRVTESFPERGVSGHRAVLQVDIEHGQGERVLPVTVQVQGDSDGLRAIEAAGFRIPDTDGPAAPRVRRVEGSATKTRVHIPVLLLPKEPGRTELVLPSLPIAVARASGEVITLCTEPHRVVVDDPIANQPAAKPKANPVPRRQKELWESLRVAAYSAGGGLVLAGLLALLIRAWNRRPKKLPPPPPPRVPWEVALEELSEVRDAGLIGLERYDEHFDRVSHSLRKYLGERYGFDGLESTSREILSELKRAESDASRREPLRPWLDDVRVSDEVLGEVQAFLEECDLVKFAGVTPTEAQCSGLFQRGEQIVRSTIPTVPASSPEPQVPDAAQPLNAAQPLDAAPLTESGKQDSGVDESASTSETPPSKPPEPSEGANGDRNG